jgi:hypothetical protein
MQTPRCRRSRTSRSPPLPRSSLALFQFRWAAAGTVLFGPLTADTNDYLGRALILRPVVIIGI